jgi:predicted AAA+ superfamily ATPase
MLIPRIYQNLEQMLESGKVLVIYGPRRAGKTTLVNSFLATTKLKYKLDTGDNLKTREIISSEDVSLIKEYLSGYELYIIDEAQKIPNVGAGLKIITDHLPHIKAIATSSSSLELSGQIGEPLTGRKNQINLFPLSQKELLAGKNHFELKEKLPEFLVFGSYPEVITQEDKDRKINRLKELTESYLLKDILELDKIKNSKIILDLLRLIAFQVGSEVSLNELGRQIGVDTKTVSRYLDLLEKSFVLFNLRGFSRNLRKEVTRKSKYYFIDNGIRNAIISNFNDLPLRDDVGKLWENFLVCERIKTQNYNHIHANNFFWRTWEKQELDWLEEREGRLFAFEFKFRKNSFKKPKMFLETYPEASFSLINQENYPDFVL